MPNNSVENIGYALGRASPVSLIPKSTSAGDCIEKILPELDGRITAMSYRVPTSVVCYCHLVVRVRRDVTTDEIRAGLREAYPYVQVSSDPLVSVDMIGETASAVVDDRFTLVSHNRDVRLSLAYDNEWGFISRVAELISHLPDTAATREP
jgi:glyceraldehyde 3-phosphate dehydrogenase